MFGKKLINNLSNVLRVVFIIIFTLSLMYFLLYMRYTKDVGAIPEKVLYLNEWTYHLQDGTSGSFTLPYEIDVPKGVFVEYDTILPDDITDGMWIAFYNSKDVTVIVGDEVRLDWDRVDADVPGGPAKPVYMYVPLYTRDAGREITILKRSVKSYNGNVGNILVGDSMSVINELMRKEGNINYEFSVLLLIISFLLAGSGVFLRREFDQNIHLINLSLGVMATSAWMVFNSNVFQLISGRRFVDGILSYVMTLIMPLPYISYINEIQKNRYKTIYAILSGLEILNFGIFFILHATGVFNFADSLKILDTVIVWIAIIVAMCIVLDVINGNVKGYECTALGLVIFMVAGVMEVGSINMQWKINDGVFLLAGLFIMVILAVIQQIRDIRVMQGEKNAAAEADRARNEFLANMSHEIRTPINAILGMNEMILCGGDEKDIKEYAKRIEKSGQILISIVNDIFDYSDFRNGDKGIDEVDYNVNRMLDGVITVLREHASVKNIGVNVGMPANLPKYLKGDPQAITRILSNINSNAVKYTERGNITFAVEYTTNDKEYDDNEENRKEVYDGTLNFYIKDTGVGIKSEDLPSLFEPFKRVDLKTNRSIEGSGLGLSIAKQLVDRMSGEINVESEYGVGTTFTISIPQKKAEKECECKDKNILLKSADNVSNFINSDFKSEQNKEHYEKESLASDVIVTKKTIIAPKARILAVDDNAANLIVIKEFLKSTRAMVDTAGGGYEAVDKCKTKTYDIIFMDHMMPELDGYAAMQQIRTSLDSVNVKTPIVVVTANAVGNCRDEYLSKGFDDYLSKPVDREKLIKILKSKIRPELISEIELDSTDEIADSSEEIKNNINHDFNTIINFNELSKRFENQQTVIDMILGECVKESEKKKKLLRDLFEEGDIQRYGVEAHGLKGVMASICASNISEHAKAHEFAAKEGRVDFIKEDIDSFITEYAQTIEFIENYLASKGISIAKSRVIAQSDDSISLEDIKIKIEEALDDFDADTALSYIDSLAGVVGESNQSIVANIRAYADDFEYDKAKEELNKL